MRPQSHLCTLRCSSLRWACCYRSSRLRWQPRQDCLYRLLGCLVAGLATVTVEGLVVAMQELQMAAGKPSKQNIIRCLYAQL